MNLSTVRKIAIIRAYLRLRGGSMKKDLIHVTPVRRASNSVPTSLNTIESTLGRGPMGVLCVGGASVRVRPSLNTRGHTPVRSPTRVPGVGTASDRAQISVDIREPTWGRSTIPVTTSGKPATPPATLVTRGHTMRSDPTCVRSATRASNAAPTSPNTRGSTPARSPTGVLCVGGASVRARPSLNTGELTPERNLTDVSTVGAASDRAHTSSDTKESTEIKSHHFDLLLHESFYSILSFPPSLSLSRNYILWSISVIMDCIAFCHHTQDRLSSISLGMPIESLLP